MEKEYLIQNIMYECCHFVYFEKWKELFGDWKIEQFDSPHIVWYLSEMVIDPILNNENIQIVYKSDFKAYSNFYKINIDNKCLMEYIKQIYKENKIEDAIKKSYQFVLDNERLIKN